MNKIIVKKHRVLAILLVFAMVLSSITPVQSVSASEEDGKDYKLVNMILTDGKVSLLPYEDDSTGVHAVLQRDISVTPGFSSSSLKTDSWDGEMTDRYWLISFSTRNFEHVTVDAKLRSSGTGPRDFKVQYSIDGTNFTDLSETITVGTSLNAISQIKLPEVASNQDKVYVRILRVSNIAVNQKNGMDQNIAAAGVSNINDIVVTGDSIDGTLPEVTVSPSVEPSQTVTASAAPAEPSKAPVTAPQPVVYNDPIAASEVPEGAVTIDKAYEAAKGAELTVVGQLQYQYGKNGSVNTAIIEDVIDGEIYGFQIYDSLSGYKAGDVLAITGKISEYGSVKQLQKPDSGSLVINKVKEAAPIGAQTVTLEQLDEGKDAYLSEYVLIKEVTLGKYSTSNTAITDGTGKSLNIYQSSAFPAKLAEGDKANVYAVFSKYNTTYQLRNGSSESSFKKAGYDVEETVTSQLAKWAGNGQFEGNVAYGDLYANNDFLDKNATFTLSTGNQPQYSNNNNGTMEYCLGQTKFALGQYFQLEFSSDKYAAMELDFQLRSSNAGAKYYQVLYSTDGIHFERANKISYVIKTTDYTGATPVSSSKTFENMDQLEATAGWQAYTVQLPDSVANAEHVMVRLLAPVENSRIDGKDSAVGTAFPCRISNVVVTGSPIVSEELTGLVTVSPEAGAVALGSEVALSCATENAVIYYSVNGSEPKEYKEDAKLVLTQLPAVVTTYAKSEGKKESVKVSYGFTQAQVSTVKASPNGGAVKPGSEVKLSCSTEGAKIMYSMDDGVSYKEYTEKIVLTNLPQVIKCYATLDGYVQSEEKVLNFTERSKENYTPYFGQIHSHTNYSDGAGTPTEAFEHATKVKNLDFLAITDHSNYFDNDTSCTISDGSKSTEWLQGHEIADQFTSDNFVGVMGYEMTWSGGAPGHMNTFNTSGFLSRNDTGYGNGSSASLVNYYAALKTVPDSISQFNHPGTTFGDFYDFAYYDTEIDQLITTIEVGNGEGAIRSSGYFPSYEYYTRALDKGWHVAPTNNQDNHKGFWGDANTARTVVLADSLTRDNIYDALRNMRTYATEDNDLSIQYTLNGEVMGTILEETPDEVNIAVSLKDATVDKENKKENIGKVEVIVNGGLSVASKTISASEGTIDFKLSPDYSYYYIKVTQEDGDIAVTAPVWVSEVDAAGIAAVTTSTAMQIQNEAADITTEIFNNNDKDLNIDKIQFTINGEVVENLEGEKLSEAGLSILPSQTSKKYTFDLTYTGLGNTTVVAIVYATANGVNKVYSNKIELNYVPRSMVSKVIVDGTHFNDYVNGYYEGSITELGQLAASYYEEVVVKKDKITAQDLKDCALMIITSPAKQSGTTKDGTAYTPTTFDDAFIALVSDYVKNGGKVVLCGIADYKDSATVQTSTELNKLLTAIGATTRINSDELCDDENYSNQNYRLYFDDYNTSSKYLNGLVEKMTYSCYSGCGILVDKNAIASGKAEAIVYGHNTTYSFDSKKMDSNYVEQQKGDIVALAYEQVGENGGAVWVGGTVFLSNYEIDTEIKNNSDELSYSNTVIAGNILKESQKELEITDIATVRKAKEGEIFTVEGYVTAGTTDVATTFFDTIYIQDDTAGIDIFPVAQQGIEIGQKIRLTGYVASYQGDKELMVMSYDLLSGKKVYKPKKLTAKEAADYDTYGGSLVKVTGKIVKLDYSENVLNYIYVKDASGVVCKALTDGYIGSSSGVDKTSSVCKVGNNVSITGILYRNPDGTCIRVRDRDEIVLEKAPAELTQTSTIHYVLNGGKNAASNPDKYTEGKAEKLANPVRTGYTFAGWYKEASFKNKITSISSSQKGDVTVYAKWTANTYKISFSRSTILANGSMKKLAAVYDKSVKLPKASFTRRGYVFAGWSKTLNGAVVYKDGATVKNLTNINGKAVTLYAKWTKVSAGTVSKVKVVSKRRNILTVFWSSVSGAEGYKITYADNSAMKHAKSVVVSQKTLTKTLTGLQAGRNYYVKVSAYQKDSAKANVYGKNSKTGKAAVKKK
ncbi:CehA/McbA family metallohydrolase [[Clostridium] polysaccharolyticum]|uniref:Listeria/Bacterioides repeat-containing protein n=1 Tax=[Clostridium] polysaccharolyticum TaxID=29364 RepID=A0A1I0DEP4_9FIRM|nr:CehA/McbA family metallohydrolase [[Clostridium] polysaccharolyticum]SET30805.1 Listeria/Bacterioides repeat-containing protein [[Clostridium] polysaccharolyticum]